MCILKKKNVLKEHDETFHRVSGSRDGAHEVKMHRFFTMVDFEALIAKQIEPPFTPKLPNHDLVTSEMDWASIVNDVEVRPMDISPKRFDDIFANFAYRGTD